MDCMNGSRKKNSAEVLGDVHEFEVYYCTHNILKRNMSNHQEEIIDITNQSSIDDVDSHEVDKVVKVTKVQLITFGVETGKRPRVESLNNQTFRCDWIPNPSSSSRKNTTGQSKKLRDEILLQPGVVEFIEKCTEEITQIVRSSSSTNQNNCNSTDSDERKEQNSDDDDDDDVDNHYYDDGQIKEKEFAFAFSCAHGKHRSISVAIEVGNLLKKTNSNFLVEYKHLALLKGEQSKKGKKKSKRKQSSQNSYNDF